MCRGQLDHNHQRHISRMSMSTQRPSEPMYGGYSRFELELEVRNVSSMQISRRIALHM